MGTVAHDASNSGFLAPYGLLYLRLATGADCGLAVDPWITLVSPCQLAVAFAKHAAAHAGLNAPDRRVPPATQLCLFRVFEQRGIVTDNIAECFHTLRRMGTRTKARATAAENEP